MIKFFILGFFGAVAQLILLREFTFSIAKNELGLIFAVGIWLIFSSLGSIIAQKKKFIPAPVIPAVFLFIFCISFVLTHVIKSLFGFAYYESVSLLFVFCSALILLSPLSFLIGYTFALLKPSAKSFGYEALGFFVGGVIFTFFLSSYSNAFIVKKEFKNAEIVFHKGTPYGPIIQTERAVYANGSLLASKDEESWDEAFVHIAMSSHLKPKKILFIGGYPLNKFKELLKYPGVVIDYVELNSDLIDMLDDELRIVSINDDPRGYLQRTRYRYDLVIMNMPAPSSINLNRFFTKEFFVKVKRVLLDGGVFYFNLSSKRDILSPKFIDFNSCIINTLDKVFPHRFVIPGDAMLVMASEHELKSDALMNNFVSGEYFTRYHYKDAIDKSRRDYFEGMLDKDIGINLDLYPRGFFYYLMLEQAKFYPNLNIDLNKWKICIIIVFIALILLLFGISKKITLINSGIIGFSSIGLISILFILFQLHSGALYYKLGLLTGLFMLGLSCGVFFVEWLLKKIDLKINLMSLLYLDWVLFILILFFFKWFYILALYLGLITGAAYPILTRQAIAAKIYAADLLGAFIGTIVFTVFFIPFLGINYSIMMLGLLFVVMIGLNLCRKSY